MDERTQSLMVGKGGEAAVMSELLFRGYNASILTVDSGVDIAAIKGGKTYLIQVKCKHWNKDNKFMVRLKTDSLESYIASKVFTVLVGRDRELKKNEFIILPISVLEKASGTKTVRKNRLGRDEYSFTFRKRIRDKGIHLVGYGDVTEYLDAWELLK